MINILMSTYNGERYLVEQLDSIFAQTCQDFVLYVRDDGSKDQTVSILKEYRSGLKDPDRLQILEGQNLGFCGSFFELLKLSSEGDYWAFSDQDDVWYPEKLKHALAWFETQKDDVPALYHSGMIFADENLKELRKYELKGYDFCFQKSITSSVFYGFSMMINKSLRREFLKCNPKNVFYHDWFMGMIVTAFGTWHFSDQVDAAHRVHGENTSAVSLASKLPLLKKLLTGDLYYERQAIEFKRVFGARLQEKDRRVLELFDLRSHRLRKAVVKVLFPRRWNPRPLEECAIRFLMLIGRV